MNKERMVDCLETERLVLFPYTSENLALFNNDLSAFEEYFGVRYRGEELDYLLSGFLKKLEKEIADDPEHYLFFTEFLIVLKENDHIIGSIDYKYVPKHGVTEIGYGMNPSYTGCGYMTEALKCFLEFGKSLGIRRVLADTKPDNVKSQNVLKRCGFSFFKEEGNIWWVRDLRVIAACGNDCNSCPRYVAHPFEKTDEELERTAKLWKQIGYRDHICSIEEMSCTGCKVENNCRYHIIECCKEKGVETCAQCNSYPCKKMEDCISVTESFRQSCIKACTSEEYEIIHKAFFEKKRNLDGLRQLTVCARLG